MNTRPMWLTVDEDVVSLYPFGALLIALKIVISKDSAIIVSLIDQVQDMGVEHLSSLLVVFVYLRYSSRHSGLVVLILGIEIPSIINPDEC